LRLCDRVETDLSMVCSASLAKGATFAALSTASVPLPHAVSGWGVCWPTRRFSHEQA